MEKLIAKNIVKSYNGRRLLNEVSLSVECNKTVALLGASGGGKTTLFNIIAGVEPADCGEVLLDGESVLLSPGKASYMPQDDLLLPYKTIIDNVSLPILIKGGGRKEACKKAREFFSLFKLSGCENKFPKEISGGMKQRAALLRTYMYEKDVMLLDEPFSALDGITKRSLYKWYINVKKELKITTLIITHDVDEALILSDKIYILNDKTGKISSEFDVVKCEDEFYLSEKFINYKKQILKELDA